MIALRVICFRPLRHSLSINNSHSNSVWRTFRIRTHLINASLQMIRGKASFSSSPMTGVLISSTP